MCGRGQDGHFRCGSGHSQSTVDSVFAAHGDPTSHCFDHREEKNWRTGPIRRVDLPIALGMLKLEENNRFPAFCITGEPVLSTKDRGGQPLTYDLSVITENGVTPSD
jgi:hypothetical protein